MRQIFLRSLQFLMLGCLSACIDSSGLNAVDKAAGSGMVNANDNVIAADIQADSQVQSLEQLLEVEDLQDDVGEDVSLSDALQLYYGGEAGKDIEGQRNEKGLLGPDFDETGAYVSYISSDCHYSKLQTLLRQKDDFFSETALNVQNWLTGCQKELSRFRSGSISSLIRYSTVGYPLKQNPILQDIAFTYQDGQVLRGFLALKDQQKRPLVIFKNGLFGNVGEGATTKNLFMQFLDESPFHVLFVGNTTGEDYITENKVVALGGFDEGRQMHEVVKQILDENSPYRDLIEDVHLVGVSLGGNAALFSSLYNSFVPSHLAVKSVIAMCPVVNLQNAVNNVFGHSLIGTANTFMTWQLLRDVYDEVPYIDRYLDWTDMFSSSVVKASVVGAAVKYYVESTAKKPWDYDPFYGESIINEQGLWMKNDFVQYAHMVKTPTLVIHAENDEVVKSKENANLLFGKLAGERSQIGEVRFKYGSHCAFNIANGWPTVSTLLREFVLKNSSFEKRMPAADQKVQGPIQYKTKVRGPNSDLQFARYEWEAQKNKSEVILRVSYFDRSVRNWMGFKICDYKDFKFADAGTCYFSRALKVKLDTFSALGVKVPRSAYETNVLSRYLNTHVTPVLPTGELPYGHSVLPSDFLAQRLF